MESPSRTQHNYLRDGSVTFCTGRPRWRPFRVGGSRIARHGHGDATVRKHKTLHRTVQTLSDAPASAVIHNERSWSDASFYETRQRKAVVHNDAPSIHTQVTAWQLHTASSLEPAWVGGVRASTGIEGVAREVRSCTRSNHDLLQNAHMWFNEAHGRRLRCRRNHNEHGC